MNALTYQNKTQTHRREWFLLAGLLVLCVVPVVAGIIRLAQLTGGAAITEANTRFFAAPIPVTLHILTIIPYSVLGALQFVPSFRRRRPGWHRNVGKFLAVCGSLVAISGLWMTLTYPWPAGDGVVLYWIRIVVGAAMLLSIRLAIAAIQRRDFTLHGEWMIRAYAIGMGAGTQMLTHLPWLIFMGEDRVPDELWRAAMMGAGWLINMIVAEWIIQNKRQRSLAAMDSGARSTQQRTGIMVR